MGEIILGDNLDVLRTLPDGGFQLIYVDPPFNTGKTQSRTRIRVTPDAGGDRTGFQGRRYRTEVVGASGYGDIFDDYTGFLRPRMAAAYRTLDAAGSLFFHIDYREVHYCKIMLDEIFGRECFINEIIWAYDYRRTPQNPLAGQAPTSSGTPKTRSAIPTTTALSTASLIWRRGW